MTHYEKTYSKKQIALILGIVMLFLASLSFVKAGGDLNKFQANLLFGANNKVFITEENIEQFEIKGKTTENDLQRQVLDADKEDIEF